MGIVDTAKDIYGLASKGLTIDLQEKLMELREQALALQEENLSLRNELLSLRQQMDQKRELEFDGSVYKDSKGSYCPVCQDKDGKLIRVHEYHDPELGCHWSCRACNRVF
jgi:hypothetical protein